MNKKDFLRSLSTESTVDSVLSSLAEIKSEVASPKTDVQNVARVVDNTANDVLALQADMRRLSRLIGIYQAQVDTNIPALKQLFERTIFDYTTAYNATTNYSKDFFANTMFSEDGKIDLAQFLLSLIKKYCQDNLETLELICQRDEDILSYMYWPKMRI